MGGITKLKPCSAALWQRKTARPPLSDDPDPKVRELKARLARIIHAAERRDRWRRLPRTLLPFAIAFCVVAWGSVAFVTLSPWPANLTARHLAAAPNCNAARAVGLAPAMRGEPGYWPWLDADNDGIACEPRRPRRAR